MVSAKQVRLKKDPNSSRVVLAYTLLALLPAFVACGNPKQKQKELQESEAKQSKLEGEEVKPPFAVQGEAEGLLLVWFDEQGPHIATKRSEIPEAHRQRVRVDSNRVSPEQRLDPEFVYVADLSKAGKDSRYTVRKLPRAQFEAWIDAAQSGSEEAQATEGIDGDGADVVLYRTSWCGACKAAEAFLRSKGVAFTAKDIERDPAARSQMQQKCQAAGRRCDGVPVIDFAGNILTGFSEAQLELLIQQRHNKTL